MRKLQIVLSILSCACVAAAAIVGAFVQNLPLVLGLMLGAVVFGCAMFFVRSRANAREDAEARRNRPDFMNAPPAEKKEEDKP